MVKPLHLSIVDVFAVGKYTGNQLAVFRNGQGLSAEEMQNIAREMHFSETTFILSAEPERGGYAVRIFTPTQEVPFAGHPTLGTAFIIQQDMLKEPVASVTLNLQIGQIPVSFDRTQDILWMQQINPQFGGRHDIAYLAPVLGLTPDDFDVRFPIQDVSTGLPHIIVPLKNVQALRRAKIQRQAYDALVANLWAKAILIFCPDAYPDCELGVRMFADALGVSEDPATGSGNGCLAGYLVKHRYFGASQIAIQTGQGFEIKRPSHLFLQAEDCGDKIEVAVGGRVINIAAGEFV